MVSASKMPTKNTKEDSLQPPDILFNFRLDFHFLTTLYRVFTQDLAWGKVIAIYLAFIYVIAEYFWWYFSITLILLLQGDERFLKVLFFVFHISWDRLLNAFISRFFYHNQGPHYNWYDGSFKLLHFFFTSYFLVFLFTYFVKFFDCYVIS